VGSNPTASTNFLTSLAKNFKMNFISKLINRLFLPTLDARVFAVALGYSLHEQSRFVDIVTKNHVDLYIGSNISDDWLEKQLANPPTIADYFLFNPTSIGNLAYIKLYALETKHRVRAGMYLQAYKKWVTANYNINTGKPL
jgi:hypothetical protein